MAPNTDQVLLSAIAAQDTGDSKEAMRLYRAILREEPTHPNANYNLGLLLVSENQPNAALKLFKRALAADPKLEKFWISYIDTLAKTKGHREARKALKKANKKGLESDKLKTLLEGLESSNAELAPSQEQVNELIATYQHGRLGDAHRLAGSITREFPQYQVAWKILGVILGQAGRPVDAALANQKAVDLSPNDAEAHYNLGVTLQALGSLEKAAASYKRSITLKPRQPKAHSNLGVVLDAQGKFSEACAAFGKAVSLDPDFTSAYINLSLTIAKAKFERSQCELYPALIELLSTNKIARPKFMAGGILSLVSQDPIVNALLVHSNPAGDVEEISSIIIQLDQIPVLHHLMRLCPLPDLQFEHLFVTLRKNLLLNVHKLETSRELIKFFSTLALHCFTNEYVFYESDTETTLVHALEESVQRSLANLQEPPTIEILCLASYRALHKYRWSQKCKALSDLGEIKARLIEEPFSEVLIAGSIPTLNKISDNISQRVRAQYEENPYPRWVNLATFANAKTIPEVFDELNLNLHSNNIKTVAAPAILIAGCGTGQHSIETASRFLGCSVTAVDLSLSSLAYAKRKSKELSFNNIEYLQADILNLRDIGKQFDIIESVGVLHHMNDPMSGWKVLVDLLRPGGMMKIGLYSELARRHITEVRKELAKLGTGRSGDDIRNFRRFLVYSEDANHQRLTSFLDFYSLSELRDLLFHTQEHLFNVSKIEDSLDMLNLKFCGFEGENIVARFNECHETIEDRYDLELWRKFEQRNPDTFKGMYHFWCQKL